MRVSNFSWAVCATILAAGCAQADEPFGALDDAPRFMFYVHKNIGGVRHKSTAPSFGFAVDRTIPMTLHRDQPASSSLTSSPSTARIFDFRVAPFDDGAIFLNGFRLTGGTSQGLGLDSLEGPSWDGPSWRNPWVLTAVILGAGLAVSCATENFPCDSSSGRSYSRGE